MKIPDMALAPHWAEYLVLSSSHYWWVNYSTRMWSCHDTEDVYVNLMNGFEVKAMRGNQNIPVIHQFEND